VTPAGRWGRVPGGTLLGDVARAMSPFAGAGTDLAMLDGAEPGLAVAGVPGDPKAAVAAHAERLLLRGAAAVADSAHCGAPLFRDDAPQGLLAVFAAHG
jgi:2-polyprenyl-6-methoxyphenol hydroxylase-like FAD-dependent oxidoreductase